MTNTGCLPPFMHLDPALNASIPTVAMVRSGRMHAQRSYGTVVDCLGSETAFAARIVNGYSTVKICHSHLQAI